MLMAVVITVPLYKLLCDLSFTQEVLDSSLISFDLSIINNINMEQVIIKCFSFNSS